MTTHFFMDGITLIDTYAYYDRPVLFTATNKEGLPLLAMLYDDDDGYETWIYVVMTDDQLSKIKAAETDFYTVFCEPDDGLIYWITQDGDSPTSGDFPVVFLDKSALPRQGEHARN